MVPVVLTVSLLSRPRKERLENLNSSMTEVSDFSRSPIQFQCWMRMSLWSCRMNCFRQIPKRTTWLNMKASSGRWKITGVFRSMTGRTRFSAQLGSKAITSAWWAERKGYVTMRRLLISIRTVSCSTPTTNVSRLVWIPLSAVANWIWVLLPTMHVPFRPVALPLYIHPAVWITYFIVYGVTALLPNRMFRWAP